MPFLCPKLSERRHRCDSDIGGHKLCLPLEGSRISRPIRTTPSAALSPPSFDWWSNHRRALVFTFALRRSPHYPAVSGGRRIAGRFLFSEFRHYRPTGPRFSKRGDSNSLRTAFGKPAGVFLRAGPVYPTGVYTCQLRLSFHPVARLKVLTCERHRGCRYHPGARMIFDCQRAYRTGMMSVRSKDITRCVELRVGEPE